MKPQRAGSPETFERHRANSRRSPGELRRPPEDSGRLTVVTGRFLRSVRGSFGEMGLGIITSHSDGRRCVDPCFGQGGQARGRGEGIEEAWGWWRGEHMSHNVD